MAIGRVVELDAAASDSESDGTSRCGGILLGVSRCVHAVSAQGAGRAPDRRGGVLEGRPLSDQFSGSFNEPGVVLRVFAHVY